MTEPEARGSGERWPTALDHRAIRDALGQFVTGIAVVTAHDPEGECVGMTVNSFNSVSLDPPLILFSVDRQAHSLKALMAAEGYVVNILSQKQEHLSNRFAETLADKWASVSYTPGLAGAPLLDGALAQIECTPHAHYDGGDHVIFLGEVVGFRSDPEGEPLVYFRGRYNRLAKGEERMPDWPLSIHYF